MKTHIDLPPDEKLYRRFTKLEQGKVPPSEISFPDISVNRALLSKLDDVIPPPHENEGVFSFYVSDLPNPFCPPGSAVTYSFRACEDPIATNAAHAEVRSFENGQYIPGKEPAKLARTYFRNELNKALKIEKQPK